MGHLYPFKNDQRPAESGEQLGLQRLGPGPASSFRAIPHQTQHRNTMTSKDMGLLAQCSIQSFFYVVERLFQKFHNFRDQMLLMPR